MGCQSINLVQPKRRGFISFNYFWQKNIKKAFFGGRSEYEKSFISFALSQYICADVFCLISLPPSFFFVFQVFFNWWDVTVFFMVIGVSCIISGKGCKWLFFNIQPNLQFFIVRHVAVYFYVCFWLHYYHSLRLDHDNKDIKVDNTIVSSRLFWLNWCLSWHNYGSRVWNRRPQVFGRNVLYCELAKSSIHLTHN